MISPTFEQDLVNYSKTQDPALFDTKLYQPLDNLFKWLWERHAEYWNDSDFEDTRQLAMLRVVKYMKHYKEGKGRNAISYARMIMKQALCRNKQDLFRNNKDLVSYDSKDWQLDQDTKKTAPDNFLAPEQAITVQDYIQKLLQYRTTAPANHRKVITAIIAVLQSPKARKLNAKDRRNYIIKKSKATEYLVLQTIKAIKEARLYETN